MNGQGSGTGYWCEPTDGCMVVDVKTLAAASKACRRYIERNGLGGGNWTGGTITDATGKIVARVSYNGRVWAYDPDDPFNFSMKAECLYEPKLNGRLQCPGDC